MDLNKIDSFFSKEIFSLEMHEIFFQDIARLVESVGELCEFGTCKSIDIHIHKV